MNKLSHHIFLPKQTFIFALQSKVSSIKLYFRTLGFKAFFYNTENVTVLFQLKFQNITKYSNLSSSTITFLLKQFWKTYNKQTSPLLFLLSLEREKIKEKTKGFTFPLPSFFFMSILLDLVFHVQNFETSIQPNIFLQ